MHYIITALGCKVNQYEAQAIETLLHAHGFTAAADGEPVDLIVVNTCAVTAEGGRKSRQMIRKLREEHPQALCAVCGCWSQLSPEDAASIGTDVVHGSGSKQAFVDDILRAFREHAPVTCVDNPFQRFDFEPLPAGAAYGRTRAMLKIQDGCNNFCTYCIVPYVRGREKSRPFEEIVDEVTGLVRQGVREITLLGQNVNSYGRDLFGKPRFADLLRAVGDTGVERIFFTSSHPKDLLPETIDAMAETPAVMPQLHLAVQSGSTRILKEMNRRYTREDYLGLVDRIRNRMPDIALSTDIIVGFPGETEEDFEQTLSLAETVRYAQAYTFIYSKRAGTPAAEIDDPTPHEVILERFNRLVKVIETTAHEYNQGELHTVVPALIEGTSKKNDAVLLGKSPKNQTVHAPIPEGYSIDQLIGKIVDVDVDVAKTWYLSGSVVGEPR